MESLIDFLNHADVNLPLSREDEARLPASRKDEAHFAVFLKARFKRYCELINQLPDDDVSRRIKSNIGKIILLGDRICQALREHYLGHPSESYHRLSDAIEADDLGIRHDLDGLVRRSDDSNTMTAECRERLRHLYRLRVADPAEWLQDKGKMFHIPLNERFKVRRQRYSIPGLPCLYLGGSVYVCWQEMKRPSFTSIFVSRFEIPSETYLKFLDISATPKRLAVYLATWPERGFTDRISHLENYAVSYAICWPLIAACSVEPKDHDAAFIEEYIIPHLLLQWVTAHKDLHGICYFSVRPDTAIATPLGWSHFPDYGTANLVFPTVCEETSGFCPKLLGMFRMTNPKSWQLLAANEQLTINCPEQSVNYDLTLNLVGDKPMEYSSTNFCKIEQLMLAETPTEFVPDPPNPPAPATPIIFSHDDPAPPTS